MMNKMQLQLVPSVISCYLKADKKARSGLFIAKDSLTRAEGCSSVCLFKK